MDVEGKLNPGMSFVDVCRRLEGWACARIYGQSDSAGLHTWDFTDWATQQTIRTTFEGGKLLMFGIPAPQAVDTDPG